MEMSDEEVPSTSATRTSNYVAPIPNVAPLDPRLQVENIYGLIVCNFLANASSSDPIGSYRKHGKT